MGKLLAKTALVALVASAAFVVGVVAGGQAVINSDRNKTENPATED